MRAQLEAAKSATKAQESQLWQAIDPDGKLTINGVPVKQAAAQIAGDVPSMAKPPEVEERSIFQNTQLLGTATPFSNFAALRGRLLQAIRDERVNRQTPALRRMTMLRSAMDSATSETATTAAQGDPALVSRLAQEQNAYSGPGGATSGAAVLGRQPGGGTGANASAGPQALYGIPGTAGTAPGRFGNPAGSASVPQPPRPQDLIGFLIGRGGVKDDAGEPAAMDLQRVNAGHFGRLSHSNGMPLDNAREAAVEAGYLHPDSDINDLLNALRRNAMGAPVFNESDPGVSEWREFERGRQRGDFEGEAPLPGEPATFDAAAAAR